MWLTFRSAWQNEDEQRAHQKAVIITIEEEEERWMEPAKRLIERKPVAKQVAASHP